MNDHDATDARLAALFAEPARAPDEAFVARVERALAMERRFAAARRATWKRFLVEAAASAAVVAAFQLLWRLGRAAPEASAPALVPAAAAVLALLFLYGLVLKPAAVGR